MVPDADGADRGDGADRLRRPVVAVALVAAAVEVVSAVRLYGRLAPGERPVLYDSVIFEYHGWWLARGARLYVDLWEVKPPLSFEVTAGLALLSGGDVRTYHLLAVAFMAGCLVATCALAATYAADRTGDPLAAVATGLGPLALAPLYWRGLLGFKAKLLVCALVVAALVAVGRDRELLAGLAAGFAVATWQAAVAVPAVLLGRALGAGERQATARLAAGSLLAGGVVLAPVLAWGALPAMVTETVLVPLLGTGGGGTPVGRAGRAAAQLGPALVVLLVGVLGFVARARRAGPPTAALLTAWFGGLVLFVDYDAAPDLFVAFVVAALGVGAAVSAARDRNLLAGAHLRPILALAVLLVAGVSVATLGAHPAVLEPRTSVEPYDADRTLSPSPPYNRTEQQYLFWNEVPPSGCRLFAGVTQRDAVRAAELVPPDEPFRTAPCGRFGPVFDAVVEKYS
jgi:hypothetical protein